MTIEKTINTLNSLKDYYNDKYEYSYVGFDDDDNKAIDIAIKALVKIEKIQGIINIDNSVIQEDVMKYKMICEVIADAT